MKVTKVVATCHNVPVKLPLGKSGENVFVHVRVETDEAYRPIHYMYYNFGVSQVAVRCACDPDGSTIGLSAGHYWE